jgi:hypothetical protein
LIPSERVPWFRERRVAVALAILVAALFAGRILGWVVDITGIHALDHLSSPAAKVVGAIGFVYAVMVIFETYSAARGTSDERDTGR